MKNHKITGGGGIQLNVVETGNPKGRPILFIHGFSQCWRNWIRQMDSDLANDFRLVAMDMRGHGESDKPQDAYNDSKLWADDVNAVIEDLNLDHPVLSGWSYGPLVILDYIRHYGERNISGIHFVSGLTKLGSDEAMSVIKPELLRLVPDFFSTDKQEGTRSLESLLSLCFLQKPSDDDFNSMLEYNVSVPSYVRQALFSRSFDNDDLLPKLRKPVLITYGVHDRVLRSILIEQQKVSVNHAQVHIMENAGHAPFWDDASNFNQRLRTFCNSL
jgi:pimeloyl-ACP methyl ester carboxylesterase